MRVNPEYFRLALASDSKRVRTPCSHAELSGRRYYSPSQGRFLGKDPKEEAGGLNLYGFCRNNAINLWDVLGMDPYGNPMNGSDTFIEVVVINGIVYNRTWNTIGSGNEGDEYRWDDPNDEAIGTLSPDGNMDFGVGSNSDRMGGDSDFITPDIGVGIIIAATGPVRGVPRVRNPGNTTLTISDEGLAVLAELEGFKGRIYRDQAGIPTIGFGHKLLPGEAAKYRNGITREQALELLRKDVAIAEAAILRNVGVRLEQEHFDALVSFVFNVGTGAFGNSTLLRRLNTGDFVSVPEEMARWNKVTIGGQRVESDGLSARRWREGWVWHGIYDPAAEGITRPSG